LTYFVVEFPTISEIYKNNVLNNRFEIGRNIYNSLANITLKRYKEMIKTQRYRQALELHKTNKREANEAFKELCEEYRLSEYEFHKDVKPMQHHFKKISTPTLLRRLLLDYGKLLMSYCMVMGNKFTSRNSVNVIP